MNVSVETIPAGELRAIARRLNQLASETGEPEPAVAEDLNWDNGCPSGPLHPARLLAFATAIAKARKARAELFGAEMFSDPAWDILLGLFIAELRGTPPSTTSLCSNASIPHSTGLRWIAQLQKKGLIAPAKGDRDGRIQRRSLTPKGSRLMHECLGHHWAQVCSPIPDLMLVHNHA
ncbi:MAG: MarR family winged helix-turn-helix transcriptional regulator [Novosphingobium sp.]